MAKKRKKGRGLESRRSFASTALKARALAPGRSTTLRKLVKKTRRKGRVSRGAGFTVSKPNLLELTSGNIQRLKAARKFK